MIFSTVSRSIRRNDHERLRLLQYRQWLEACWQRASRETPDQRLLARIADEIEITDIALAGGGPSRRDAA